MGDDLISLVTEVPLPIDFKLLGEEQSRQCGGEVSVMGCTALNGF